MGDKGTKNDAHISHLFFSKKKNFASISANERERTKERESEIGEQRNELQHII